MSALKSQPKKIWNRNIPDSVLLVHSTANALAKAESLSPSLATIGRALQGEARARAIIDAWAFRAPVITLIGGLA